MSERDHVMPNGPWQFDRAVTAAFDDMLQRSIPQAEAAAAADPTDAALAAVAADKAQALADYDAKYAGKFGPGWVTRWQESEYDNPDDEAVDVYINDGPFAA